MNEPKKKPFSMIREFHLADWFTLGNAVCGVGALFSMMTYLQVGEPRHVYYACALVVAALVVGTVLKRTPFGIALAMTGSNPEATRYSSVDTGMVLIKVYTLSGGLCFVAGCLMLARFNSASAAYAKSYLLVTVLAAVLGGVDPFGGFGRIGRIMLALLVLQLIASGCNLLGFSDYLTLGLWGLTLITVMAAQRIVRPG